MAYLTHDAGTPDNPRPKTTERVGFTEVENLVPCSPARARRIMAATVRDAEALKRLAGVSSRGRRLQKPVYHFSLSWAPDENPDQPTMLGAALDSLRVLGMRHHQAVVIEHREREHPHVHVVVNRVSPEDGRAASTSNDARHLSRWAADWELQHGGIRCRGRVDREHGPKRERRPGPGRQQRFPEEREKWAELFAQQDYEEGGYFHQYADTPPGFDEDLIEAGARELAEKHTEERAKLSEEQARDARLRAGRVEALAAQPGGKDLYHAHLADRDPEWVPAARMPSTRRNTDAALAAAESDTPRLERLRGVLSNEAAGGGYRKELGKVAGQFNTADIDRALAAGEQERERQAALKTATAATQAAAARSNVKPNDAGVLAIYETGATHKAGIKAVERMTRALDAAADEKLPAKKIIETWGASRPARRAEALDAAVHREKERKEAAKRQAALKTATAATQAAAARSGVELRDGKIHAIYETGATHKAGIKAVERTERALDAAADQQLPAEIIHDTWKANESAPGGIAAALETVTAAAREEQKRKAARQRRWDGLAPFPGAQDAARAQFDQREPDWRDEGVSPRCFGQVLDAIEQRVPKSLAVREASRRKGPDFSYEDGRHYNELLKRAGVEVLGDSAAKHFHLTPQQHAQVLDKTDQLDGIERVVEYAQRTGEELLGKNSPPAHDTIRSALRKVAAETGHDDPRWKQIAAAAATGPIDYLDPGLDSERAAIEQHLLESDRRQADRAADRQHQETLGVWNAQGRVRKAVTRRPERQEPEEPASPAQARIDEYRQETLIRRIVKTIRDVLKYFISQELVPADQAAARAVNEQPREPEPPLPEHNPDYYRGR